ncbi:hypothetical protein YC2023_049563 [Brassica napus]
MRGLSSAFREIERKSSSMAGYIPIKSCDCKIANFFVMSLDNSYAGSLENRLVSFGAQTQQATRAEMMKSATKTMVRMKPGNQVILITHLYWVIIFGSSPLSTSDLSWAIWAD